MRKPLVSVSGISSYWGKTKKRRTFLQKLRNVENVLVRKPGRKYPLKNWQIFFQVKVEFHILHFHKNPTEKPFKKHGVHGVDVESKQRYLNDLCRVVHAVWHLIRPRDTHFQSNSLARVVGWWDIFWREAGHWWWWWWWWWKTTHIDYCYMDTTSIYSWNIKISKLASTCRHHLSDHVFSNSSMSKDTIAQIPISTTWSLTARKKTLKIPKTQKERIVFQPSIFSGAKNVRSIYEVMDFHPWNRPPDPGKKCWESLRGLGSVGSQNFGGFSHHVCYSYRSMNGWVLW